MELNKYDMLEYLTLNLKHTPCIRCPLRKDCIEIENKKYTCFDEDETRELLIKKYNL